MASYYYLISSLPMLKTQGDPPMDYAAFLAMCKSAVSSGVYQTLEELTAASDKGPLLSEWAGFYKALCRELTYQRNVKLGRPCAIPSDRDAGIVQTVTAGGKRRESAGGRASAAGPGIPPSGRDDRPAQLRRPRAVRLCHEAPAAGAAAHLPV